MDNMAYTACCAHPNSTFGRISNTQDTQSPITPIITEYLTDMPPIQVLEAKLHEAIRVMAHEQIALREAQQ